MDKLPENSFLHVDPSVRSGVPLLCDGVCLFPLQDAAMRGRKTLHCLAKGSL